MTEEQLSRGNELAAEIATLTRAVEIVKADPSGTHLEDLTAKLQAAKAEFAAL